MKILKLHINNKDIWKIEPPMVVSPEFYTYKFYEFYNDMINIRGLLKDKIFEILMRD
jgi:hypothetical protein